MDVLLNPEDKDSLLSLYQKAFDTADEIYIATAFLTDWSFAFKLGKQCNHFVAVVGTNFGLTRKKAFFNILKWLPHKFQRNVFAFPQNESTFHPKILVWKKQKKYFALVGSSNLTIAALSKNYEINSFNKISKEDYDRITQWFEDRIKSCDPVSKNWIDNFYEEAKIVRKKNQKQIVKTQPVTPVILKKMAGYKKLLAERQYKLQVFKKKKRLVLNLLKSNAKGQMKNAAFWKEFKLLWHMRWKEEDCFRFQGSGVERTCTNKTNWKKATSALVEIIESNQSNEKLDELVAEKIDILKRTSNPARKAWLSEMLCQFFPKMYPVLNTPVKTWIKENNWALDRGGTEGQKYIDLARRLRSVVRQNYDYVKNLAELDTIIWKICPPMKKSQL